jgi:hypothetical protein
LIKIIEALFKLYDVLVLVLIVPEVLNDGYESTTLGDGVVDPKAVSLLAKEIGGAHHFIIEQESYQKLTPLEAAKVDLDRMKTWNI